MILSDVFRNVHYWLKNITNHNRFQLRHTYVARQHPMVVVRKRYIVIPEWRIRNRKSPTKHCALLLLPFDPSSNLPSSSIITLLLHQKQKK